MLGGGVDVLWLLGADELGAGTIGAETFVIYQGHHGDAGAQRADVILPGAAYTEKNGLYVNTEGRVQQAFQAVKPPGDAREDWSIIRAISAYLGHALPYDTLEQLRAHLAEVNPVFGEIGRHSPHRRHRYHRHPPATPARWAARPLCPAVENYYQTDPVSRASPTMAACVAAHYAPVAEAAE